MSHAVILGESATKRLLDEVSIIGPGDPWFPVSTYVTYHVIITGVADVRLEVSNDVGSDDCGNVIVNSWVELADSQSTCGFQNVGPWRAVRARVDSLVVGTVTVILGT